MRFNLGAVLSIVTRALAVVPGAVAAAEAAQRSFKSGSGADKKAAVLELVQAELLAAEHLTGKDLANDADVCHAAGLVIDAAAAFQKLVALKAIGPTP